MVATAKLGIFLLLLSLASLITLIPHIHSAEQRTIECGTLRNAKNSVRGFVCHDGRDLLHIPFPHLDHDGDLQWTKTGNDLHEETEVAARLDQLYPDVTVPGRRWGLKRYYWHFGEISHIPMGGANEEREDGEQAVSISGGSNHSWLSKVDDEGELSWRLEQTLHTGDTPATGETDASIAEWELGVDERGKNPTVHSLAMVLLNFITSKEGFRKPALERTSKLMGIAWKMTYRFARGNQKITRNFVEKALLSDELSSSLGAIKAPPAIHFLVFGLDFYAARAYSEMGPELRAAMAAIIKQHGDSTTRGAASGFFSQLGKLVAEEEKEGPNAKSQLFVCFKFHGRQIAGYAVYKRAAGNDEGVPVNYARIVHLEMAPLLQLLSATSHGEEAAKGGPKPIQVDHNHTIAMRTLLFELTTHLYRTNRFRDTEAEPAGVAYVSDSTKSTSAEMKGVLIEVFGVPKQLPNGGSSTKGRLYSLQFNASKEVECGRISAKEGKKEVWGLACHDEEAVAFVRINLKNLILEEPAEHTKLIKKTGAGWTSRFLLLDEPKVMGYKGWLEKLVAEWEMELSWVVDYKVRLGRWDYEKQFIENRMRVVSLALIDYAITLCKADTFGVDHHGNPADLDGLAWKPGNGSESAVIDGLESERLTNTFGAFSKADEHHPHARVDAYVGVSRNTFQVGLLDDESPNIYFLHHIDVLINSRSITPAADKKSSVDPSTAVGAQFHSELKAYRKRADGISVVDAGKKEPEEEEGRIGVYILFTYDAREIAGYATYSRKAYSLPGVEEEKVDTPAGAGEKSGKSKAEDDTGASPIEDEKYFFVERVVMAPEIPSYKERFSQSPSTGISRHRSRVAIRKLLTGLVEHLFDEYFYGEYAAVFVKGAYFVGPVGKDAALSAACEDVFGSGRLIDGGMLYSLEFNNMKLVQCGRVMDVGDTLRGVACHDGKTVMFASVASLDSGSGGEAVEMLAPPLSQTYRLIKQGTWGAELQPYWKFNGRQSLKFEEGKGWLAKLRQPSIKDAAALRWEADYTEEIGKNEWGANAVKSTQYPCSLALINYAFHLSRAAFGQAVAWGLAFLPSPDPLKESEFVLSLQWLNTADYSIGALKAIGKREGTHYSSLEFYVFSSYSRLIFTVKTWLKSLFTKKYEDERISAFFTELKNYTETEGIEVLLLLDYSGREVAGFATYNPQPRAFKPSGSSASEERQRLLKKSTLPLRSHHRFLVDRVRLAPPMHLAKRADPSGNLILTEHNNHVAAQRLVSGLVDHLYQQKFVRSGGNAQSGSVSAPEGIYLEPSKEELEESPALRAAYDKVFGKGQLLEGGSKTRYSLEFVRKKVVECGRLETKRGEMKGIACHDNELVIYVSVPSLKGGKEDAILVVPGDGKAMSSSVGGQPYWKFGERGSVAYKAKLAWIREMDIVGLSEPKAWSADYREEFHVADWGIDVIKVPGQAASLGVLNYALRICNEEVGRDMRGTIAGIAWMGRGGAKAAPAGPASSSLASPSSPASSKKPLRIGNEMTLPFVDSIKSVLATDPQMKALSPFKPPRSSSGQWDTMDFYFALLHYDLPPKVQTRIDQLVNKRAEAKKDSFYAELKYWIEKDRDASTEEEEEEEDQETWPPVIYLCTNYAAKSVEGYVVYEKELLRGKLMYHVKLLRMAPENSRWTWLLKKESSPNRVAMWALVSGLVKHFRAGFNKASFELDKSRAATTPKGVYWVVPKSDANPALIDMLEKVFGSENKTVLEDGSVRFVMEFKTMQRLLKPGGH